MSSSSIAHSWPVTNRRTEDPKPQVSNCQSIAFPFSSARNSHWMVRYLCDYIGVHLLSLSRHLAHPIPHSSSVPVLGPDAGAVSGSIKNSLLWHYLNNIIIIHLNFKHNYLPAIKHFLLKWNSLSQLILEVSLYIIKY